MVANPLSLLRSRKTYSRYLKKIPPSENATVFLLTQYLVLDSTCKFSTLQGRSIRAGEPRREEY
eukprot:SAG11_NODE_1896_length_4091_cov_48.963176_3_plen_64_part_00